MDRKIIDITALGLADDGFYNISNDDIYVIKSDSKINIKPGIKAYLIDNTEIQRSMSMLAMMHQLIIQLHFLIQLKEYLIYMVN